MRSRYRWALGGVAAVLAAVMPVVVAGAVGNQGAAVTAALNSTVGATADTSISQVTQDGDNAVKTTLATCPTSCDGNPAGQREAVLQFALPTLPAGATVTSATVELYTWTARAATIAAFPASGGATSTGGWADRPTLGTALSTRSSLVAGYNAWDVTAAVTGRTGAVTFAFVQSAPATRIYFAAKENATATTRPRLVVNYTTATAPPTTPPTTPAPTTTAPAGWNLVWNDEFDGTALNSAKWNARNNSYTDYDLPCITNRPQNVSVGGGNLTVRAQKEHYTCGSHTAEYTTAYLDTINKASFTYGRFEIRAKTPTGPTNSTGLWPAFWLRPNDGGNGEIDVVELPGGAKYYSGATQAIFHDYTPTKQDHSTKWTTVDPAIVDPTTDFHTYTTEWEAGVMRWYIDGKLVWTRDRSTTSWFDSDLSRPFHLRINFQVGGWLGNPDAATAFPAAFTVDYVRVWQR